MGFGVKNPDEFIQAAPPMGGAGPAGAPSVGAAPTPEIVAMLQSQQQPPQ